MKKILTMLLITLVFAACGNNDNNSDSATQKTIDKGLFSTESSLVSDFSTLEGLWESNQVQADLSEDSYVVVRIDLRADKVTMTNHCYVKGKSYYSTVSSPAEKLSNGDIKTLETNERVIQEGDVSCVVTLYQATLKQSDISGGTLKASGMNILTKVGN